jgi:hypothetical protein
MSKGCPRHDQKQCGSRAGQCINVTQIVNDASREAARQATRRDITNAAQFEQAVHDLLASSFESRKGNDLMSAVTVKVADRIGPVVGSDRRHPDSGFDRAAGVRD